MAIRWKVVKIDLATGKRYSVTATEKYCREYPKGATVKALPNTLGLMTFKTKCQARQFQGQVDIPDTVIIRVKSIGKGKRPSSISIFGGAASFLDAFYSGDGIVTRFIPSGTICYPAVEVLD